MISVLLLCWQKSGDRLGLFLIGLFKVPIIRDLAEETVDGSAFDGFFYVGNNRENGWGYV